MDIVWERENRSLNYLCGCDEGDVVMLKESSELVPFLVIGSRNSEGSILLFNLDRNTFNYFSPNERVEILQTELHIR